MKVIADQAKAILERKDGRSVAIYFIPRRTIMCETALEQEGVFNRILKSIFWPFFMCA
jgi:hypothetical protein